jgi:hypothetical protein
MMIEKAALTQTCRRYVVDPSQFPRALDDQLQPELVWVGMFRGGDVAVFDTAVSAADPRLGGRGALHMACSCSSKGAAGHNENLGIGSSHSSIVPAMYAELANGNTLRNAATYKLHEPMLYEPRMYHRRTVAFFCDVFLNPMPNEAAGMITDHELDHMTSGQVEEDTSLLSGLFKSLGFDQPAKKSSNGNDKNEKYVDVGQESKPGEGSGISGLFNSIANSVAEAVSTVAAAVIPGVKEDDDHKYLEEEAADLHFEEDDDAREKCCFCIPTAPVGQVKYLACTHKLSEYDKGEDEDLEAYSDKNERCEHSMKAHKDFWKCLQRINQTEPLPFAASEVEAQKRREIDLKWMSSALGFNRYIQRRKELMNRKRCSLKKGLREGTAKLLTQPPEPDMDSAMLVMTLVRYPCHCCRSRADATR